MKERSNTRVVIKKEAMSNTNDKRAKALADKKARVMATIRHGYAREGTVIGYCNSVPGVTVGGQYFKAVPPLVTVQFASGKMAMFYLEDVEVIE